MQKIRKNNQGFTIIEVLIVLAIAGLILLIVFLAVPALQRNSRNNGRRNDASRFAAAVNDYVANNNGQLPPNDLAIVALAGGLGNFAQYDITGCLANCDMVGIATGDQAGMGSVAGRPRFRLVTGAICSVNGETDAGTDRQGVVQYQLETGNNAAHTNVCLEI